MSLDDKDDDAPTDRDPRVVAAARHFAELALDDTEDDPRVRAAVRRRTRTPVPIADEEYAARVAELVALPGSEWARGVDAKLAELDRRTTPHRRWRRIVSIATKWIGGGLVTAALGLTARALIAHGDASATDRARVEMLERHDLQLRAVDRSLRWVGQRLSFIAGKLGLDLHLDDNAPQDPTP